MKLLLSLWCSALLSLHYEQWACPIWSINRNCFFLCDAVHYCPYSMRQLACSVRSVDKKLLLSLWCSVLLSLHYEQFGRSIETASFYVMQCTTIPALWGSWHSQFGQSLETASFSVMHYCHSLPCEAVGIQFGQLIDTAPFSVIMMQCTLYHVRQSAWSVWSVDRHCCFLCDNDAVHSTM